RRWLWFLHSATTRLRTNSGRSAAPFRWRTLRHHLICSDAEPRACVIRPKRKLAVGKVASYLEKLHFTKNKLTGRSQGKFMAAGLFRSASSRRKTFRELRALYPQESCKGAPSKRRIHFVRERACAKDRVNKEGRFPIRPLRRRTRDRRSLGLPSSNATGKQPTSSAIETAVPGEFREIRRIGRCGVGVAKWKADHRPLRRVSGRASRKPVDERHTRFGVVGDEGNRQRVCLAYVARTQDRSQPTRGRVLARVCSCGQRKSHACAVAVASSRALRSGSASRRARLRRS